MRLNRFLAYLSSSLALGLSFFVYVDYVYLLGFPDGFITELDYAERRLARVFIAASFILSSYFIYLGNVSSDKKIGKRLFTAISLYLVLIFVLIQIGRFYRHNLMDGAGG